MSLSFSQLTAAVALAAAAATPAFAVATHDHTLLNGRSVNGVPIAEPQAAKVVDVATARSLNVNCGEVVTFKNGDKSFSWKFESAGHRAVDLQAIAPAGFVDKSLRIYVSRSEAERS